MKHRLLFYQKAKEAAQSKLEKSIRQEAMLCEEEREALRRERQEEAAELIDGMRKNPEAAVSDSERQEQEEQFWELQATAVRLARKLSLNLESELVGGTGRLVFSASDIIFTGCNRQETYELFRELLDPATLIWFLADASGAGQVQLCLEYCYLEGGH